MAGFGRAKVISVVKAASLGPRLVSQPASWVVYPQPSTDGVVISPGDTDDASRCGMNSAAPSTHLLDAPDALDGADARIDTHLDVVDQLLHRQLTELRTSWALVDGCDIAGSFGPDLPAVLLDLVERGGKRTRPVMTYVGWVAGGGHERMTGYADAVRASAAVEMLHAFAIIHDDVMDESRLRRGRPTVHADAARQHADHHRLGLSDRFGDSVAVLVGDLAHAEADAMAATLPLTMRRIWQRLMLELVAGQYWDLTGSAAGDRRLTFARAVARQKTGNYTVTRPLQLGAAAAGANSAALDSLARFGRHAGEAFALRDDLLGVFGDSAVTGKPAGEDLRAGKPTALLAVTAACLGGPEALADVGSPAMTDAQVASLQQTMIDSGVVVEVERMIDDRVQDAVAALDASVLTSDGVATLTRTVLELARRGR